MNIFYTGRELISPVDVISTANGSLPESTQLTDGIVPVLTDLQGQTWARQLFTHFNNPFQNQELGLIVDLSDRVQPINIEVAMLNCPQWNIGTGRIRSSGGDSREKPRDFLLGETTNLPTSCEGLVHVYLPAISTITAPFVALDFSIIGTNSYVHIGEIIFNTGNCPGNLLVSNPSKFANN